MKSQWVNEFSPRVSDIVSDLSKIKDVAEISREVKEIRRGLDDLKPTKGSIKTKF